MRQILIILLLALGLSACATASRLSAANDVHALLVAIRDNDRAGFEAHVDRDGLKRELVARLAEQGNSSPLGTLAAALAPGLADIAGEALINPKVFRKVAEYYGYKADSPIPNTVAIAGSLRAMPDGRVCATKSKKGPCMLIFSQSPSGWRLSGFQGDISMLRIKL